MLRDNFTIAISDRAASALPQSSNTIIVSVVNIQTRLFIRPLQSRNPIFLLLLVDLLEQLSLVLSFSLLSDRKIRFKSSPNRYLH